jgi:hypothetical protein
LHIHTHTHFATSVRSSNDDKKNTDAKQEHNQRYGKTALKELSGAWAAHTSATVTAMLPENLASEGNQRLTMAGRCHIGDSAD